LNILALIALELNHLAHLRVDNDSAIASKLLLDDLENFLLIEFLGQALDRGQRLTTIALCGRLASVSTGAGATITRPPRTGVLTLDTDVDVVLRLLGFASILIGLGEGVCKAGLAKSRAEIGRRSKKDPGGSGEHTHSHHRSDSIAQMQRESRCNESVLRRKLLGFSCCAGRLDSPKVLRFSMDINSCLAREPGVSLLWWSERRRSVSLRILWERMWRVEIGVVVVVNVQRKQGRCGTRGGGKGLIAWRPVPASPLGRACPANWNADWATIQHFTR
jgi:hypothetical protein